MIRILETAQNAARQNDDRLPSECDAIRHVRNETLSPAEPDFHASVDIVNATTLVVLYGHAPR